MIRRYYRDSDKIVCDVFSDSKIHYYRFTANRVTGFISGAVMLLYFADFDGIIANYSYEFQRFLGLLSSPKFIFESFSEKTEVGNLFVSEEF